MIEKEKGEDVFSKKMKRKTFLKIVVRCESIIYYSLSKCQPLLLRNLEKKNEEENNKKRF